MHYQHEQLESIRAHSEDLSWMNQHNWKTALALFLGLNPRITSLTNNECNVLQQFTPKNLQSLKLNCVDLEECKETLKVLQMMFLRNTQIFSDIWRSFGNLSYLHVHLSTDEDMTVIDILLARCNCVESLKYLSFAVYNGERNIDQFLMKLLKKVPNLEKLFVIELTEDFMKWIVRNMLNITSIHYVEIEDKVEEILEQMLYD